MKKIYIALIAIYLIFGISFYLEDLHFSRLVIRIEGEQQKIDLVNEVPTAFTMILLWPFLLLGKLM